MAVFSEFDFQDCPDNLERATLRNGEWLEDETELGGVISWERNLSIPLYLTSYNGEVDEDIKEWFVEIPISALAEATVGTWLVPVNLDGDYAICFDKNDAIRAILTIADNIWNKSGKAPTIEAIRLDENRGTRQSLRIYQFWFSEPELPPHVTAIAVVDLK